MSRKFYFVPVCLRHDFLQAIYITWNRNFAVVAKSVLYLKTEGKIKSLCYVGKLE